MLPWKGNGYSIFLVVEGAFDTTSQDSKGQVSNWILFLDAKGWLEWVMMLFERRCIQRKWWLASQGKAGRKESRDDLHDDNHEEQDQETKWMYEDDVSIPAWKEIDDEPVVWEGEVIQLLFILLVSSSCVALFISHFLPFPVGYSCFSFSHIQSFISSYSVPSFALFLLENSSNRTVLFLFVELLQN